MSQEALEHKRKYNREYANREDIKIKRREYKREWRRKKKLEDPEYWRKEAASKEARDKAQKNYWNKNKALLCAKAREHYHKKRTANLERFRNYRKKKYKEDPDYYKKQASDKKKIKARSIANQLPLKEACEKCGSKKNLERHHPDYNQPKVFVTLCKDCHAKEHRKYLQQI